MRIAAKAFSIITAIVILFGLTVVTCHSCAEAIEDATDIIFASFWYLPEP